MVAVEGRGPLDGAVALLRAGLRVGGPNPGPVHPAVQAQHAGLSRQTVDPQRDSSVVHVPDWDGGSGISGEAEQQRQ